MSFFDLPPKTLTLVATLLGFLMMDDLTANQQNSLGNFFELIGQILLTSAAQRQLLNSTQKDNKVEDLEKRLEMLERYIRENKSPS